MITNVILLWMHDKKSWEIKFVNIKKLNAFRAVLESNSITGAADKLGLTQSGVSRLILSLEQELDFPLFNRIKGKIQVTSRGESFFQEITILNYFLKD